MQWVESWLNEVTTVMHIYKVIPVKTGIQFNLLDYELHPVVRPMGHRQADVCFDSCLRDPAFAGMTLRSQ